MKLKLGLAITTYSNSKTSDERYKIIRDCFESVHNNVTIEVVIVNDGSEEPRLLEILDEYSDRFEIVTRVENGGISKAKNDCIKCLFEKDCDIMFLMDDDVLILQDFTELFENAITKSKISHFNYIVKSLHPELEKHGNKFKQNKIPIQQSPRLNGCFMTITKEMVETIGYFKVLPNRYGHEHTEYTLRAIRNEFAPGFVDLQNSEDYIGFHELAYVHRSEPDLIDDAKILENSKVAFATQEKYIEYLKSVEKASLRNLSLVLRRSDEYIKRDIEPDLIRKSLIMISSRGRMLNDTKC